MFNEIKSTFLPLTNFKAAAIISLIGFIIYGNGLFNGFVVDDFAQIVNNPLIHSFNNILLFFTGGTFYKEGVSSLTGIYYRPLTVSIFSIIYTFFGPNAFWFHLTQLFIHMMNTFLIFLLFKTFFKNPLAFILSLIFLIHPVNSESVLSASAMQDVLFFLFGIVGLLFIINYKKRIHIVSAIIFLLLSLFSKETGIAFLIITIIYIYFFKKKILLEFISYSIVVISIYSFLRIISVGLILNPLNVPITYLKFTTRLLNLPQIVFIYLKNLFIPYNLTSSYQFAFSKFEISNFYAPLIIILIFIFLLILILIYLYKNNSKKLLKTYIFFLIWLILGIGLHLHFIPLDATIAERWFYFPIVGFLGIVGVLITEYIDSKKDIKNIIIVFTFILLILFSIRTFQRTFDWRNDFNLALHDSKISKNDFNLENRLALGYINSNNIDQAKIHAQKSVQLFPILNNNQNLGLIYLIQGNYDEAIDTYKKALRYKEDPIVRQSIALAGVLSNHNLDAHIKYTKISLSKNPNSPHLWLFIAIMEYKTNNHNAVESITKAYNLSKNPIIIKYYYEITNGLPIFDKFPVESYYSNL